MIVDRASGPFGEVGGIPDMIPMSVGEEEGVGFKFFFAEKIEETFGGIYREEVTVEVEEVGIGGGEATGEDEGIWHVGLFTKKSGKSQSGEFRSWKFR